MDLAHCQNNNRFAFVLKVSWSYESPLPFTCVVVRSSVLTLHKAISVFSSSIILERELYASNWFTNLISLWYNQKLAALR